MNEQRLWYRQPAACWTQALPLGNGRLGAMVFGGTGLERIALNEDTLWSGFPQKKVLPGAFEGWKEAQKLMLEDKPEEAAHVIEEKVLGPFNDSYLPLGDLLIEWEKDDTSGEYCRELLLPDGIARVSRNTANGSIEEECWISEPAQVLAVRLRAGGGETLSFTAKLTSQLRCEPGADGEIYFLEGLCPSRVEPNYVDCDDAVRYYPEPERTGIRFRAGLAAACVCGSVSVGTGGISVSGAAEAVLFFGAYSNFNGWNNPPELRGREYRKRLAECLRAAISRPYDELTAEHLADWRALYDRVKLTFGSRHPAGELPTDRRLVAFQEDPADIGMCELLFHYGRYLTIAASRKGTQPANLQGIWNAELRAPWSSNYTVNINTEMNYWPTLVCSLPECYEPLLRMIGEVAESGAETAREQYHAGGFVAHHNVDLWRSTNSVGNHTPGSCVYGFWPFGAGWLCSHVAEYYRFTRDRDFLQNQGLPLLRGCARFFLDVLTERDGQLFFCPATSPENCYIRDEKWMSLSVTTTMATAIIREALENYLFACRELGLSEEQQPEAEETLRRLPPFAVGSRGQLLEWDKEEVEADPHHRHTSHLYPFHPAALITRRNSPELTEAVKKTLLLRGDDGTGWSLGWKISQWARLGDGNHAFQLIQNQLRPVSDAGIRYDFHGGTYENLFDAHPPFQIDGNFAFTAGLCEMLLQRRDGCIELLPALPDCMPDGEVRGLTARGGYTLDFSWKNGALTSFTVSGGDGKPPKIVCSRRPAYSRRKFDAAARHAPTAGTAR